MKHEFNHGTIYQGDCLDLMKAIPDGSVDMVLADLPYGTTACHWDSVIPFEPLWEAYKRIAKERAAIVLTASQPFTSALVMSNIKMFRYCWVYSKTKATNYLQANNQPMKYHEDICVFGFKKTIYNAQIVSGKPYKKIHSKNNKDDCVYRKDTRNIGDVFINEGYRQPSSIISPIANPSGINQNHSTEKPVKLFEYLIRTYTNKGDTILDNVIGSGTTGVACYNTGRRFIGIEKDAEIYNMAVRRIDSETRQLKLF